MVHVPDPLDLPARPESLRHQAVHDVLDVPALRRAFTIAGHTPSAQRWMVFLDILLLVLGAGMLLSGIVFFFAFNWADMHRFAKLGLLQGGVVVAVGLAFWLGLDRIQGKVVLTVAALLFGGLLAVYGQIYQTGADAYELFLSWSLFTIGWVVISRFTPFWLIWLLAVNLTILLYWDQAGSRQMPDSGLFAAIFALNAVALGLWELARQRGVAWVESRWTPRVIAILMIGALAFATQNLILDSARDRGLLPLFLMHIVATGALIYIYSYRLFDAFMLIVVTLAAFICLNTWLAEVIDSEEGALILIGILVIAQTAGVVTWIRSRANMWEAQHQ
ncbi:MAG: DUF2157 domain-containing protein [Herpetosiphonaceae bacterium]|nr:DUF2157 domain-containing protein [Herpetosiphonaceae bacterium]